MIVVVGAFAFAYYMGALNPRTHERFYARKHNNINQKPVTIWPSTGSSVLPDERNIEDSDRVRRAFGEMEFRDVIKTMPAAIEQYRQEQHTLAAQLQIHDAKTDTQATTLKDMHDEANNNATIIMQDAAWAAELADMTNQKIDLMMRKSNESTHKQPIDAQARRRMFESNEAEIQSTFIAKLKERVKNAEKNKETKETKQTTNS